MLNVGSAVEAERIFNALAADGMVQIPFQESFWAARFGVLVDQFGTPWTIDVGSPCVVANQRSGNSRRSESGLECVNSIPNKSGLRARFVLN